MLLFLLLALVGIHTTSALAQTKDSVSKRLEGIRAEMEKGQG